MIIKYIKSLYKPVPPKFYDKEGNEVKYLQYYPKTGMILIERNGKELIPVNGLDKI